MSFDSESARLIDRIQASAFYQGKGKLEMRMAVTLIIDWLNFASFNKN